MRRLWLGLLLGSILLLSGCIEVHVRQQFFPNGRSTVLQQINLGQAIDTLRQADIPPPAPYGARADGWDALIADACQNVSSAEPGAYCHVSDGWLIIDQDRVEGSDYVLTSYEAFPYTVYDLTVLQLPDPPLPGLEAVAHERLALGRTLSGANQTAVDQARLGHMRYLYTIVMPGEITEYDAGHPADSGLEVDALAQMARAQPIHVKSRTVNVPQLALLGIAGLDLLLFFDLVFIWVIREWRRRRDAAMARAKISEAEEAKRRVFRKNKRLRGSEVYSADESSEGGPKPFAPSAPDSEYE